MLRHRMQGEGEQILMSVNGPAEPLRETHFPALAEHGKGGFELGLTPLLHSCRSPASTQQPTVECHRLDLEPGLMQLPLRSTAEDQVPMACGGGESDLVQLGS